MTKEHILQNSCQKRWLFLELANDMEFHMGKDKYGNDWHVRNNVNGTQDWVRHMNQVINEGGQNASPRKWDSKTGLNRNPWKE